MGDPNWWLSVFAGALYLGLQVALPAVLFIAAGGLTASFLQALIGYGDAAVGFALRAIGAIAGVMLFGGWLAGVVGGYWQGVGRQLTQLLRSGL
ncbi:MAG: flagellar biosynthetic protein FliQ [Armatimonadetes bacterium]|nr:flagellar biosynthetic protein FliQ [Armatimonadota bacterium]